MDINDNDISNLDISNNTALVELSLGFNNLGSLDVSQNTALESLECDVNFLTSLNVSNNVSLTYLTCSFNDLSSLDVSNNPNLTCIDDENDINSNWDTTSVAYSTNCYTLSTASSLLDNAFTIYPNPVKNFVY